MQVRISTVTRGGARAGSGVRRFRRPFSINARRQEDLFPAAAAVPFDAETARRAAALYSSVSNPHPRPADLAIAACALVHDAALRTLNPGDFSDLPDLKLM